MKNGRTFSKRVENTVGKGEIARYEKFPLFPPCFQKSCFPGASKGVVVCEWVNRKRTEQNRNFNLTFSAKAHKSTFKHVIKNQGHVT